MSRVRKILVDECARYICLRYREALESAGYEVLDINQPETDPLALGSSDDEIFAWADEQKNEIAIITANKTDFLRLHNSRESDLILLFVSTPQNCSATELVNALNYINTNYSGFDQFSIPQVLQEMRRKSRASKTSLQKNI